ncbi:MAG: hypothetical protein ACYS99_10310, partial [Planctomycetota bacterium]
MRAVLRLSLTLFTLLSLAGLAQAQGVELLSGQKLKDTLDEPGEVRVFRFHAPGETRLNLKIVASKKTDLAPIVVLLGPSGPVALPELKKGKLKAKKIELVDTGMYLLTITGGGTTGDYKLAFKLKLDKSGSDEFTIPGVIDIDMPRGTLLTIKVTAEGGVEPGFASLTDPTGEDILDKGAVTEKGGTAKLKKQLCPVFGRHDLSVVDRSGGAGGAAKLKGKLKLAKTKVKKLGPEDLIDAGAFKVRAGSDRFAFFAWAENGAKSARLRHPDGTEENLPEQDDREFGIERMYGAEAALHAAYPDGLYTILITRHDDLELEIPAHITGSWPGEVVVTDEGQGSAPTITWSVGAGDPPQVISLELLEEGTDDGIYQVLLPGTDRSHTVPEGRVDGKAYEVEVWAVTPGLKVSAVGEDGPADPRIQRAEGFVAKITRSTPGPPYNRAYMLEGEVEGTEIDSVALRLPTGGTLDLDEVDPGEWHLNSLDDSPFPDGSYTFLITFDDMSV